MDDGACFLRIAGHEHEHTDEQEPHVHQHSEHDHADGDVASPACGDARRLQRTSAPLDERPQYATAVEGKCGQEVEAGQQDVCPPRCRNRLLS